MVQRSYQNFGYLMLTGCDFLRKAKKEKRAKPQTGQWRDLKGAMVLCPFHR